MRGQDLYKLLFDSLDLPDAAKVSYLEGVLTKYGVSTDELTVEILREIVADFLQETILEHDRSVDTEAYVQNQ